MYSFSPRASQAVAENLPAMQEKPEKLIWSLGGEDPLEEEMATHSSILALKIPWKRSLVGYSSWVHKRTDMTERLNNNEIVKLATLVETYTYFFQ